jgi:mRNA interferase RelE/StbE
VAARYQVALTPAARRDVATLPPDVRQRVDAAILALGDNPRPPGSKRIQGTGLHRTRVGNYRVLYRVKDDALLVLVVRVGRRSIVYRRVEAL